MIIKRIFWSLMALIMSAYAIAVSLSLPLMLIVWLTWWIVTGKEMKLSKVYMTLFTPTLIAFDKVESLTRKT